MPTYKPIPIEVENALDEFGKLLNIQRFPLEGNVAYKRRLLNCSRYWGSSTKQGLLNAVASELGARVYSNQDKAFFYLSKEIILKDPGTLAALPVVVTVGSTVFADFDITGSAVNSYKIWKLSDGTPTRIIEFKTVPGNNVIISIEYYYLSDGIPTLWRDIGSDRSPEFIGSKEETPQASDIEVYELHDSAFQTEFLLDADGFPNASYKAIVDELHKVYPMLWSEWKWGKTFWDVADETITQIDHFPNRYDLSLANLTSGHFDAGVGDGTDCSVIGLETFNDGSIRPIIAPGYFHIDGEEYYLYGRKCFGPPSGDFYASSSPVVATKLSASKTLADAARTPFARTWFKGSADIFRHSVRLSGAGDVYFDQSWAGVSDPWFHLDMSGNMAVSGTFTGRDFLLQYDSGGDYVCPIELNPVFSPVLANKILGIQKSPTSANWINYSRRMYLNIFNIDGYMKRVTSATYDSLAGGGFYPDFDINIRAEAFDELGVPLKGWDIDNQTLNIRLSIYYAGTALTTTAYMAETDGSIVRNYADYANRSVTDAKGLIISGMLVNGSTNITSTLGVKVIPLGIAK